MEIACDVRLRMRLRMRLREIAMRASENIRISSPIIGEEEIESVKSVMLSGMLAQGACVREFEREFADFTGVSMQLR